MGLFLKTTHVLSDRTPDGQNQEPIGESGHLSEDLVGPAEPLSILWNEYHQINTFLRRVRWLVTASEFTGLHRLRVDGNCFYRAFSYSFVDAISKVAEDEFKDRILRHVDSTLEALKQSGIVMRLLWTSSNRFRAFLSALYHHPSAVISVRKRLLALSTIYK